MLIHWLELPSWNRVIPTYGLCYREPIIALTSLEASRIFNARINSNLVLIINLLYWIKLQGDLLRADLYPGESGMCPNGVQGEQIMHKQWTKPLFKNLKILSLRYCCTVPVATTFAGTWFLVTFEKLEPQTDYHMPSAHVHRGIINGWITKNNVKTSMTLTS